MIKYLCILLFLLPLSLAHADNTKSKYIDESPNKEASNLSCNPEYNDDPYYLRICQFCTTLPNWEYCMSVLTDVDPCYCPEIDIERLRNACINASKRFHRYCKHHICHHQNKYSFLI